MSDTGGLPRSSRRELVGTLERGLAVLEALAEHAGVQGRTLTEISELVDMNVSTTSRILSTLLEWGYVRRLGDRYGLGLRTLGLGKALLGNLDLRQEARSELEELSHDVELTCHLGVLDRGEVVYIDKVEPSTPFQMRSRIGERMPAHCTALGKAALAFSPATVVTSILAGPLNAQTRKTVVKPDELRRQLQEIRRLGYAIDDEENEEGVRCVGGPVFDHRGHLIAAISVSGPTFTVSENQLPTLGRRVSQAGLAVSRRLGYRPYWGAEPHWSEGGNTWWQWIPTMTAVESNGQLETSIEE